MLLAWGCTKQNELSPPDATANQVSSFEEQLNYLLPLIDDHHDLEIKTTNNAAGEPMLVFYFVPREADQGGSRQVVCQGSGIGFIRCCNSWYDAHPGKCLKITRDDKGVYSADDNC